MKILFIFPTVFEADAFFCRSSVRARVGSSASFKVGESEFFGLVCGYGSEAARNRVENFCASKNFDFAILCGFCGSCSCELSVGDFAFDTKCESLNKIFAQIGAREIKFAFANRVADNMQKAEFLRDGFKAVEMESDYIKDLFKPQKFAHLRVVSDGADSDAPIEFLDAIINRKTGCDKFLSLKAMSLILKNPLLLLKLKNFAKSVFALKKIYDKRLFTIIERIAEAKI